MNSNQDFPAKGIGNMKLNKIISSLAGLAMAAVAASASMAAEEEGSTPPYPLKKPRDIHWSFAGPFGHWDLGQLQRGLKVYKEVCSACHSMNLVAFRSLEALGYSEEQVKALAAEYTITDGPNTEGDMFERPGIPSDHFPAPFPNKAAAAAANNGAAPPDFSLIAKARAPERGFPTFIFDIFTQYAENGPDYLYSLLTGYQDPPAGTEVADGTYYNPYFVGGKTIAMANPLSDGIVTYDDGTAETLDQYARDVSAFLMWAAEPTLVERKALGFKVMIFLLLLAALTYLTKKKVWAGLHEESESAAPRAEGSRAATRTAAVSAAAMSIPTAAVMAPAPAKAAPKKPAAVKAAPKPAAKAPAKKAAATGPRPGKDFIDDVELIDGVGATIAKRLKAEGFGTLSAIAGLSDKRMAELAERVNAANRYLREEWQVQAREMIAGKAPRAQVAREKVERMLNKKF